MKFMFLSESGLGNALLALPVYWYFCETYRADFEEDRCFHLVETDLYWHGNPLISPRMKFFFYPSKWRQGKRKYHAEIIAYIQSNDICTVIDLRNETGEDDVECIELAQLVSEHLPHVNFISWHHFDETSKYGLYIQDVWKRMFTDYGIVDVDFSVPFQAYFVERVNTHDAPIVLYVGASRKEKMLEIRFIILLMDILIKQGETVMLLSGPSELDRSQFASISKVMIDNNIDDCKVSFHQSDGIKDLVDFAKNRRIKAFICPDTAVMHLAYLAKIPTIGYYLVTDHRVWGPADSPRFMPVMSEKCKTCSHMPIQGCCMEYLWTNCRESPDDTTVVLEIVNRVKSFTFDTDAGKNGHQSPLGTQQPDIDLLG